MCDEVINGDSRLTAQVRTICLSTMVCEEVTSHRTHYSTYRTNFQSRSPVWGTTAESQAISRQVIRALG